MYFFGVGNTQNEANNTTVHLHPWIFVSTHSSTAITYIFTCNVFLVGGNESERNCQNEKIVTAGILLVAEQLEHNCSRTRSPLLSQIASHFPICYDYK